MKDDIGDYKQTNFPGYTETYPGIGFYEGQVPTMDYLHRTMYVMGLPNISRPRDRYRPKEMH